MPKVEVLNIKGENVGEIELNETLFAADIAETAVYDTVKNQLANKESHSDKKEQVELDKDL